MASAGDAKNFQGFLQFMGALESNRAHRREAKDIRKQGARAAEEGREEARRERIEGKKFAARQRLAFLKSGVSLEGSPLLSVAETEKENVTRVDRMNQSVESNFQFARSRAKTSRSRGRSSMGAGFAQSAGTSAEGTRLKAAEGGASI